MYRDWVEAQIRAGKSEAHRLQRECEGLATQLKQEIYPRSVEGNSHTTNKTDLRSVSGTSLGQRQLCGPTPPQTNKSSASSHRPSNLSDALPCLYHTNSIRVFLE